MVNNNYNLDITKTIRIIEKLKSQLLMDIAQLYSNMSENKIVSKDENLDILSDILIISYLLGNKFGNDYENIDKRVLSKIRLNILETEYNDYWSKELSKLSTHINNNHLAKNT